MYELYNNYVEDIYENICWEIAVYLRLSREDEKEDRNLSSSIQFHAHSSHSGNSPPPPSLVGEQAWRLGLSQAGTPLRLVSEPNVPHRAIRAGHHPRSRIPLISPHFQDDLEVSPDFFEYFDATSPILWSDPTLYCVSAWNDNGQVTHVHDPSRFLLLSLIVARLFRSDFFPGLGWMLTRTLWEELGPTWPGAYWDDWLRHPNQRKNRGCIRPEVSRSYTFGEMGTSNSQ